MITNDGACWRQIRHGWFLGFSKGQSPPNMKFHNSLDFYRFWVATPCQEGKGKKASLRNDQFCVKLSLTGSEPHVESALGVLWVWRADREMKIVRAPVMDPKAYGGQLEWRPNSSSRVSLRVLKLKFRSSMRHLISSPSHIALGVGDPLVLPGGCPALPAPLQSSRSVNSMAPSPSHTMGTSSSRAKRTILVQGCVSWGKLRGQHLNRASCITPMPLIQCSVNN